MVWGVLRQQVPGRGYVWLRNCCVISDIWVWYLYPSAKAMSDTSLPGVKGAPETPSFQKGLLRKWMERNLSTDFSFTLRGSIRDVMFFLRFHIDGTCQEFQGLKFRGNEARNWGNQEHMKRSIKNDGGNWRKIQRAMTWWWNKNMRWEEKCFCVSIAFLRETLHSLAKVQLFPIKYRLLLQTICVLSQKYCVPPN